MLEELRCVGSALGAESTFLSCVESCMLASSGVWLADVSLAPSKGQSARRQSGSAAQIFQPATMIDPYKYLHLLVSREPLNQTFRQTKSRTRKSERAAAETLQKNRANIEGDGGELAGEWRSDATVLAYGLVCRSQLASGVLKHRCLI